MFLRRTIRVPLLSLGKRLYSRGVAATSEVPHLRLLFAPFSVVPVLSRYSLILAEGEIKNEQTSSQDSVVPKKKDEGPKFSPWSPDSVPDGKTVNRSSDHTPYIHTSRR